MESFYVKAVLGTTAYEELIAAATSPNGAPLPSLGKPADVLYFVNLTVYPDSAWAVAYCFRQGIEEEQQL